MNVTGGPDMTLHEVTEAAQIIHDAVLDDAIVTFGSVIDDRIQGEIQITVIATGFEMKTNDIRNKDIGGIQNSLSKPLSAADFFQNAFNQQNSHISSSHQTSLSQQSGNMAVTAAKQANNNQQQNINNIKPKSESGSWNILDIPDFLKK